MNLTLRTLLAWLDDTLPPAEVKEIGKKFNESPFAKELGERIQRVTRRRRLSVPNSTGPDATDPNIVSAYLDNELPHDQVAEFEKKCLTSDVHLAEVASVHQVLSMLSQRAKVPPDAKQRMYRLVKGREATNDHHKHGRNHRVEPPHEPVTEPIAPWLPPAPEPAAWARGAAPVAAVAGLLLLLATSVWLSLTLDQGTSVRFQPLTKESHPVISVDSGKAALEAEALAKAAAAKREIEEAEAKAAEAKAAELAKADAEKKNAAPPPVAVPVGAVATVTESEGLLLRYSAAKKDWERIQTKAAIHEGERIVAAMHSRHTLQWGKARVTLLGPGSIKAEATPNNAAGGLELFMGRFVLTGAVPAQPFRIALNGQTIAVTPPAATPIGIERREDRATGAKDEFEVRLSVFSIEGETTLTHGADSKKLAGSAIMQFLVPNAFTDSKERPAPEWLTDTRLRPIDQQLSDDLVKLIRPDSPLVASLAEAMDDSRKEIRTAAIQALGMLGEYDLVISALSKPDDPDARKAAMGTIRKLIEQSEATAKAVYQQLAGKLGEGSSRVIEKLIVGFSRTEAEDPSTYSKLVALLEDPDVGVRQLAIDNLTFLTGRDSLGYKPDNPDKAGLAAWRDLLNAGELKAATAKSAR